MGILSKVINFNRQQKQNSTGTARANTQSSWFAKSSRSEKSVKYGSAMPLQSQAFFALSPLSGESYVEKSTYALTQEGFARNPIVFRCVKMIAESAAQVAFDVHSHGEVLSAHPLLSLLRNPNKREAGRAFFEAIFANIVTTGNAYIDAVINEGEVVALYGLRPDRMQVVTGLDGWPTAYTYTVGTTARRLSLESEPVARVLHIKTFNPLDDHYGFSPLKAAQDSLETHNAATRWNRALLENAARPSGALVYNGGTGNLTEEQFERVKAELENGFAGAMNAGRPMVLEGGLDWKTIALTPRDMDFLDAKNAAAREIALALGVPPLLLGIQGDNTYANYAEANRTLWRQTIIPLVELVMQSLNTWLGPVFDGELVADFDGIEALADDRAAQWERVGGASFLSETEKREILGFEADKPIAAHMHTRAV